MSELLDEFRRPLCELGRVRVLQNVLELRSANARVDLQVLRRLHEERDAFDAARGVAQPFDDLLRVGPLIVRLKHNVKARRVYGRVHRARAD